MEVLSEEERRSVQEISKELGFDGEIMIDVRPFTKTGDNYLGVLFSLEVTGKDAANNPKTLFLVLKKMHGDKKVIESLNSVTTFAREVDFYSNIAPALRDFQKEHCHTGEDLLSFIPKCYKTKSDGLHDYMILEDLRKSGFVVRDRVMGLSYEECMLVMESLGALHAFSYAMKQKDGNTFRKLSEKLYYSSLFQPEFHEKYDKPFQKFVISAENGIRQLSPDAAERLAPFLSRGYYSMMTELASMKDDYSVIAHGDTWTNNILFRGDPPTDLRFLDYQVMHYTSPVIDVTYTLNTSISKELREAHFDDFLEEYHLALTNTLRKLGANPESLPKRVLKDQIKLHAMKSLGSAVVAAPLFLGGFYEEEKNCTEEDAMSKIAFRHFCCMKDRDVQQSVLDLVNFYIDRGFID